MRSPPKLRAMYPLGTAPLIEEDGMLLAESAPIVEYIVEQDGRGCLPTRDCWPRTWTRATHASSER